MLVLVVTTAALDVVALVVEIVVASDELEEDDSVPDDPLDEEVELELDPAVAEPPGESYCPH